MTLPALAEVEDLAARTPGGAVDDETRAQAALDDASAWIRLEARQEWADGDVPDIARTVCLSIALRIMSNPEGVSEQHIGTFGEQLANASADAYLTKSERAAIQALRPTSGLYTISTTRGDFDVRPLTLNVVYSEDGRTGEPMPYLNPWDVT